MNLELGVANCTSYIKQLVSNYVHTFHNFTFMRHWRQGPTYPALGAGIQRVALQARSALHSAKVAPHAYFSS